MDCCCFWSEGLLVFVVLPDLFCARLFWLELGLCFDLSVVLCVGVVVFVFFGCVFFLLSVLCCFFFFIIGTLFLDWIFPDLLWY